MSSTPATPIEGSDFSPWTGLASRRKGAQRPVTRATFLATDDLSLVREAQSAGLADNTVKTYQSSWKLFTDWCEWREQTPLPASPLTVAKFLAYSANLVDIVGKPYYSPRTLLVWLAAISKAHEVSGFDTPGSHPEVKLTMDGIMRKFPRPLAQKSPLLLHELCKVLAAIERHSFPSGIIGRRDTAVLLFGFVGACRRSELGSLAIGDISQHEVDGLYLTLRRSKSDQEAKGFLKVLPYGTKVLTCAPCAFAQWIRILHTATFQPKRIKEVLAFSDSTSHACKDELPELRELDPGAPLFRPVLKSGRVGQSAISFAAVNEVVKSRMRKAGMDSAKYGSHSLRAGFVTQSFRDGANHHEVMRQTGHKNPSTVEIYSREHNPLLHNSVTRIAL
jgi:integrase